MKTYTIETKYSYRIVGIKAKNKEEARDKFQTCFVPGKVLEIKVIEEPWTEGDLKTSEIPTSAIIEIKDIPSKYLGVFHSNPSLYQYGEVIFEKDKYILEYKNMDDNKIKTYTIEAVDVSRNTGIEAENKIEAIDQSRIYLPAIKRINLKIIEEPWAKNDARIDEIPNSAIFV